MYYILCGSTKNKILIHCQYGKSISAILILAFFIKYFIDNNFHWDIQHNIVKNYIFKLIHHNKSNNMNNCYNSVNIDNFNNTDENINYILINNFIEYFIILMQKRRNAIQPNKIFIKQLINWIIDSKYNIYNLISPLELQVRPVVL